MNVQRIESHPLKGGKETIIYRDRHGKEYMKLNLAGNKEKDLPTIVLAVIIIHDYYREGKLTDGLYYSHVQSLLSRGLPGDYTSFEKIRQIEKSAIEKIVSEITTKEKGRSIYKALKRKE